MPKLDDTIAGSDLQRSIYDAVVAALDAIGVYQVNPSKSQIAFRRRISFAWVWWPGQYLRGKSAPLVLSIRLRRRDASPRWKQIVEPYPGRFIHHLEIESEDAIDETVQAWLREAWEAAG